MELLLLVQLLLERASVHFFTFRVPAVPFGWTSSEKASFSAGVREVRMWVVLEE